LIESVAHLSPDCAVVLAVGDVDAATLGIVKQIRTIDRSCPLLILTPKISVEGAVGAMRAGITNILDRSASCQEMIEALQQCSPYRVGGTNRREAHRELAGGSRMVGQGTAISRIRDQIARVASTDVNVLITGESGTGKELAAELIHRNSQRRDFPFVAMNCAALPDSLLESELFGHEKGAFTGAATAREGKLQYASRGTLFLDEVADMSLVSQAKILRAVESRVIQRLGSNVDTPVRARLVSATNQDLESLTRDKKFRQDLYFRLGVVKLKLPALRERLEDIPELTEHIVKELTERERGRVRRIESDVIHRFQRYNWPGNIRQLRNVLETILVLSSSRSIGMAEIPAEIREILRVSPSRADDERFRILSALNSANWNRKEAAQVLCCSRMTLYRKMVKLAITSPTEIRRGAGSSRQLDASETARGDAEAGSRRGKQTAD
jgi:DNA-binding NtrC family response regulator